MANPLLYEHASECTFNIPQENKFLALKAKIEPMAIYEKVYEIVRQIPRGKVLTYGVISHMIDKRLSAQGVGWALNALKTPDANLPDTVATSANVPWQRVVNSRGGISTHKQLSIPPGKQRQLLEEEGVLFQQDETIVLKDYLWRDL